MDDGRKNRPSKCPYCKCWDDPQHMVGYAKHGHPNSVYRHKKCQAANTRRYREVRDGRMANRLA